ncbi:hypothetical protein K7887_12355 [Sutcliffiella horikoshii]|uniref:exonuclease domain-containing protein n=1 Tax=Sutcliffiella horikoshii TaxID=79883 RepID=UPI001CBA8F5D|nr:exonuclease domain-containing protein [Sutcliffiella horikoshii]UAL45738.1 hypothetical protein K7887_12355 [Sutcliffiella horikoshii]
MKQRFVVLDLETTGNTPKKNDKIIQVGAVLIEDGEIVERFASFVNPQCTIPPFIEQLTNINQEMVDRAPTFAQIAPMLCEMLKGSSLVAHNVPFDLSFLQHELKTSGHPTFSGNTFDTVEMARILLPTQKSYKLTDLSIYYELNHDNPHRADSDAEATAIIFLKLLKKIQSLPSVTINQLHTFLHTMKSDIHLLFQQKGVSSSLNHVLYDEKLAVRKASLEPIEELEKAKSEMLTGVKGLLSPFDKELTALLDARQHGLLEITASHKLHTLGALAFALENNKKVVVSSATKETKQELEQQILSQNKHAAFLLSEIKGKYYYLSLSRLVTVLAEADDNYDAVLTKAQILVWLTETETGDMEELSLSSGGRLLWDSINCSYGVSTDDSLDDLCFYTRAKNRVKSASIIFTNHMFLAKEIWKPEAFMQMDYFLVEDAGLFQESVGRFLGKEISYLDLYFTLSRLKDTTVVQQAKEELDEAFRLIRSYCLLRTKKGQSRVIYRYDVLKEKSPGWYAVLEAAQRLYMKLTEVLLSLEKEAESTPLKKMRDTFHALLFSVEKHGLTWFDVHTKGAKNSVTIYEQPLDVSGNLAEKFYQQKSSVLFVSPALSVDKNFDYMLEELGLTDFYPKTISVENAGTNYPGVFIPTDMPAITRGKNEAFNEIAAMQLLELLEDRGGRILVTFSSLEMLSAVYQAIKSLPNAEETVVVSQSSLSGGKQKILKAAANFEKAILFVTNGFLEEVNLQDEKIDTLVIMRLPFKSMDEPVMAAKIATIEGQGRNSFTDVSLPIAVLRFKAMISRFLEAEGPKEIFIFDKRVVEKRYGNTFLQSIPNAIVKKDSFFAIMSRIN